MGKVWYHLGQGGKNHVGSRERGWNRLSQGEVKESGEER